MQYISAVWRARNHLTEGDTARALYNFGCFDRRHGQFDAAAKRLEESLALATHSGQFDDLAIGRRKVELAAAYAGLQRWTEGADLLLGASNVAVKYEGPDAEFVRLLVEGYVETLQEVGDKPRADSLIHLLSELPPSASQAPQH